MDDKYKDAVIENIKMYIEDDDEGLIHLHRNLVEPCSKRKMINEIETVLKSMTVDEISKKCKSAYDVELLLTDLIEE